MLAGEGTITFPYGIFDYCSDPLLSYLKEKMTLFINILLLAAVFLPPYSFCWATEEVESHQQANSQPIKINLSQCSFEELVKYALDNNKEAQEIILEKVKCQSVGEEQLKRVNFLKWYEEEPRYVINPVYIFSLMQYEDKNTVYMTLDSERIKLIYSSESILEWWKNDPSYFLNPFYIQILRDYKDKEAVKEKVGSVKCKVIFSQIYQDSLKNLPDYSWCPLAMGTLYKNKIGGAAQDENAAVKGDKLLKKAYDLKNPIMLFDYTKFSWEEECEKHPADSKEYQIARKKMIGIMEDLEKEGFVLASLYLGDLYIKEKNFQKAYVHLKVAAQHGRSDAQFVLGDILSHLKIKGKIHEPFSTIIEWVQKSALQKFEPAIRLMGWLNLKGIGIVKNPVLAIQFLNEAVTLGEKESLYWLGVCHQQGEGVEQSEVKAQEYFKKYSNSYGDCEENIPHIGKMYQKGRGRKQDLKKALIIYKKQAEEFSKKKRDVNSLYIIAKFYESQAKPNYSEVSSNYRQCQNHPLALFQLALLSLRGLGEREDRDKGVNLIKKSIAQVELPKVLYMYVLLSDYGLIQGEEGDKVLNYLNKAAENRYTEALFRRGISFSQNSNKQQADKDFNQAYRGYEKKSNRGDAYSFYRMGMMQALGYGMEANPSNAFNLFVESAQEGNLYSFYLVHLINKQLVIKNLIIEQLDFYGEFKRNFRRNYKGYYIRNELEKKFDIDSTSFFPNSYRNKFLALFQKNELFKMSEFDKQEVARFLNEITQVLSLYIPESAPELVDAPIEEPISQPIDSSPIESEPANNNNIPSEEPIKILQEQHQLELSRITVMHENRLNDLINTVYFQEGENGYLKHQLKDTQALFQKNEAAWGRESDVLKSCLSEVTEENKTLKKQVLDLKGSVPAKVLKQENKTLKKQQLKNESDLKILTKSVQSTEHKYLEATKQNDLLRRQQIELAEINRALARERDDLEKRVIILNGHFDNYFEKAKDLMLANQYLVNENKELSQQLFEQPIQAPSNFMPENLDLLNLKVIQQAHEIEDLKNHISSLTPQFLQGPTYQPRFYPNYSTANQQLPQTPLKAGKKPKYRAKK